MIRQEKVDRPWALRTREELLGTSDGTRIIISGTNFAGASEVSLRQGPASFEITRFGTIRAIAPPEGAKTVDVTVTCCGTPDADPADRFTCAALPAPTVTGLAASTDEPSE